MENWGILAVIVAVVGYVVMLYNRIIALLQKRKNAFSDIDVQLKQRFDTIPNLVETVKGYAAHEKGVFEEVTKARSRVSAASGPAAKTAGAERIEAEGMLGRAMMNLFAVAENYPELKADQNFRQLQAELVDLENKISAARRFFNNATSEYNTSIQQFPAIIIARLFNFQEEPFFELDPAEQKAVQQTPSVKF